MYKVNTVSRIREWLENNQVAIYFIAILAGGISASLLPAASALENIINPSLALMLYVTFLQVPVSELGKAFIRVQFILPLLLTNFLLIPILVAILIQFLPDNDMLMLGVLLVLLTPCIDYVVTFTQLGKGDSRLLLASTPVLLIVQILMLPVYLHILLGEKAVGLVQPGPFIHAFIWLIMIPLCLAAFTQFLSHRNLRARKISEGLSLLPVPATAIVLLVVVAAMLPQLSKAVPIVFYAVPVYVAFAALAPLCGWGMAKIFRLEAAAGRAIMFSGATRNSLVVLPLALSIPGAIPILPAVIVTQTMIELVSELIYIRLISKRGHVSTPPSC